MAGVNFIAAMHCIRESREELLQTLMRYDVPPDEETSGIRLILDLWEMAYLATGYRNESAYKRQGKHVVNRSLVSKGEEGTMGCSKLGDCTTHSVASC